MIVQFHHSRGSHSSLESEEKCFVSMVILFVCHPIRLWLRWEKVFVYLFMGKCVFWSGLVASSGTRNACFHLREQPGKFWWKKKKRQHKELKEAEGERTIHEGWRIKSCTFVFNFPQRSLKPNQSDCIGGQNWHVTHSSPPTSRCSVVLWNNIFSHRQRTCLITPFIRDEARLRSASLPPVLTAVTVCPSPPPHAVRHSTGKVKRGKRAHARGLRCGIRCQSGPRLFPPKGHIMLRDWLSAAKPLSSLINKTSHPFALIPQAAHMQECATRGKSCKRSFLHVCSKGARKKFHNFYCFYVSPFRSAGAWRANSTSLSWLCRRKYHLRSPPFVLHIKSKPQMIYTTG